MSWRLVAIVAAAVLGTTVGACATDTDDGEAGPATAPVTEAAAATATTAPAGSTRTIWQVSLTSEGTELHTVGADDELVYGWNHLTGSTTLDGRAVDIELLGSVDYVDGTGPWSGFLSVVAEDGTLGLRADGHAERDETTRDTTFTAELVVIGGSGRYVDAAGSASLTGERLDALGGQVDFDVTMNLSGMQD